VTRPLLTWVLWPNARLDRQDLDSPSVLLLDGDGQLPNPTSAPSSARTVVVSCRSAAPVSTRSSLASLASSAPFRLLAVRLVGDDLFGILLSFRGARSDVENLTSLLAQLPTVNPPEIARMVSIGLGPTPVSDTAEILSSLLDPARLGALRHSLAAPV